MTIRTVCALLTFPLLFASGCAMPGGTAIGPCSYMTARMNERSLTARAITLSALNEDRKELAFQAVNLGAGPEEIAAGFQINVMAFKNLSKGELLRQAVGAGLDCLGYAVIGGVIYQELKKEDTPDPVPVPIQPDTPPGGVTFAVNGAVSAPVNITVIGGASDDTNTGGRNGE